MALYSPAYAVCNMASQAPNIITDRKNNFTINQAFYYYNTVNQNLNAPWRTVLSMRQLKVDGYNIQFDYITLNLKSFINISRNNIFVNQPLAKNSNLNSYYFYLGICVSSEEFDNTNPLKAASNIDFLQVALENNKNLIGSAYNNFIFTFPFCQNFSEAGNITCLPSNDIIQLPLNYVYEQFQKGFFITFISGIQQPNYNLDLSYTGNGLLDHEFGFHVYPALPNIPFASAGNYGSRYFDGITPTNAISSKIVSWNINFNIYLQGKILA